jgi:hypothetical protein
MATLHEPPGPCDAHLLWPNADLLIQERPKYVVVNRGGLETKSDVYAVADDPLKVPGCKMCLVIFLEGSPVAVRYHVSDIYQIAYIPYQQ